MSSIKNLISGKSDRNKGSLDIAEITKVLNSNAETNSGVWSTATGLESFDMGFTDYARVDQSSQTQLQELYHDMEKLLSQCGMENYDSHGNTDNYEAERQQTNQIMAATYAGVAAQQGRSYVSHLQSLSQAPTSVGKNTIVMSPRMDGPAGTVETVDKGFSLENYNEKPTREFRVITVAYSLAAARQDGFGEALYPTVVVNPQEGGVVQNLTYVAVMRDVYHTNTGALFDTREVNMIEAFRDGSILDDASTKIWPIVDEQGVNENIFVDSSLIEPTRVELEHGQTITTAPLRMGAKFDLVGNSNRNQLVAANILDLSDTIDPAMQLKNLYITIGGKAVRFFVERLPRATFQPNLIGNTREAILNFDTEELVLSAASRTLDGSTSEVLNEIAERKLSVRLSVGVHGKVSLTHGTTAISSSPVSVDRVLDEQGTRLATDEGDIAAIIEQLGDMTAVAYDINPRFTNTNRRERGQLIQTRTYQFRYPIPMHAPITLPMSTLDDGPTNVVKALTVATNLRNSVNAVRRLLNYIAQLREVVVNGYNLPKFGEMEGALSIMMRPTYRYVSLNLSDVVDSIRSGDRWNDITSAIINTIKAELFPAYRDSNIEAVFQAVTGDANERPKFIIATDKVLANYLMTTGDVRTLGSYLQYDIVSTNNELMDNKIIVVPTRARPVENDILNFGQFYYVPTIIADLPISRHGQTSREIAAIPYNLHVNNIPFAIEIDVSNLHEVMGTSISRVGGGGSTRPVDGFDYNNGVEAPATDSGDVEPATDNGGTTTP